MIVSFFWRLYICLCIIKTLSKSMWLGFFFYFILFSFLPSTAGKILFFYTIFYACLTGFFIGLLAIFWQTLDTERPKWQLHESLIGTNPGLGFRPMPPEAHLGSTLIWYKSNRPDNMIYWHDTINKFLEGKFVPQTKSFRKEEKTTDDEKKMFFFCLFVHNK